MNVRRTYRYLKRKSLFYTKYRDYLCQCKKAKLEIMLNISSLDIFIKNSATKSKYDQVENGTVSTFAQELILYCHVKSGKEFQNQYSNQRGMGAYGLRIETGNDSEIFCHDMKLSDPFMLLNTCTVFLEENLCNYMTGKKICSSLLASRLFMYIDNLSAIKSLNSNII